MVIITPTGTDKQKLTRRQHIVPRLLLANFTDPASTLWVYSKDKPARASTPDNECLERDFYEYEFNGRKTSNKYENWLGRIESDASAVLRLLADRQQQLAPAGCRDMGNIRCRPVYPYTESAAADFREHGS